MKRAEGFTADDGTWFATRGECRRHEEIDELVGSLVGLSEERVRQAIERCDAAIELADAIERAGKVIGDERRASGELRRLSKKPDAGVAFENVAKAMAEKVKLSGHEVKDRVDGLEGPTAVAADRMLT